MDRTLWEALSTEEVSGGGVRGGRRWTEKTHNGRRSERECGMTCGKELLQIQRPSLGPVAHHGVTLCWFFIASAESNSPIVGLLSKESTFQETQGKEMDDPFLWGAADGCPAHFRIYGSILALLQPFVLGSSQMVFYRLTELLSFSNPCLLNPGIILPLFTISPKETC